MKKNKFLSHSLFEGIAWCLQRFALLLIAISSVVDILEEIWPLCIYIGFIILGLMSFAYRFYDGIKLYKAGKIESPYTICLKDELMDIMICVTGLIINGIMNTGINYILILLICISVIDVISYFRKHRRVTDD